MDYRCDCENSCSYLDLVNQIKRDFKNGKNWENPEDNCAQIIDITKRCVFLRSGTNSITKKRVFLQLGKKILKVMFLINIVYLYKKMEPTAPY